MSFTHRVVLPLAGVAAALSMVTISLAAETAPTAPPSHAPLPAACQLPATNPTPTAKVADDDRENNNDDDGEINSTRGEAIRACIEALRAEGKHDFRDIIALIARARAERNNHEHEQDDDSAPTATTTATPVATATATPERRGIHTPPTHHRD
jgi:hypothetical protein